MSAQTNVLTYHNDNARTGQNKTEAVLTPANVNSNQFGKLISVNVDGDVYAQPLVLTNVSIPGQGAHNVVYVATENDSLYAIDADNGAVLWQMSFINSGAGVTAVPSNDVGCGDISPQIGISGTPVIDPGTGTIYLVAKTKENGTHVQRLHAIDVASHAEKFGGPVVIQGSVSGTGTGNVNGTLSFDPLNANQRAGLLLQNGHLIIAWGSHCDNSPFHGWVMSYNPGTLAREAILSPAPNGTGGTTWMSGAGVAADANSNIYPATGNGAYDGTSNFGDTILKLSGPSNGAFTISDWFTPYDQATLGANDIDVASGGVILLPDLPSGFAHQQLLVLVGKLGTIYLVDRNNMGRYCSGCASDTQIVQEIANAFHGVWGMPAYWNSSVYIGGSAEPSPGDTLKAYSFNANNSGLLSTSPTSQTAHVFTFPGPTPSVSANGSTNGVVWALDNSSYQSSCCQVLHAYNASNLATELYNTTQAPNNRDALGGAVKFTVPTVANGKVYVGSQSSVTIYGLLATNPPPPTITTTSLPNGTQNANYNATLTASGGVTPYSWSIMSGTLPSGLSLAQSTGVIAGTPTGTGSSNFTVQVTDSNSQTATKALSITINAATGGITLRQFNAVEGSAVGSVSIAFSSANTAGNMIVAFVRMSTAAQTVTVTDTAGNTYTKAVSQAQTSDGHQTYIFYAKNIAGAANTVKATFSATNNHPWLGIYEYSGLSTTAPLDKTAAAQGTGTNATCGPTAATSSANELVFGGLGLPNNSTATVTAGGGYTLQQQDTNTSRAANETAIVASTGAQTAAFGLSLTVNWSCVLATFSSTGVSQGGPTITTTSLPNGVQNTSYNATLTASGGVTPYSWTVVSGTLPTGLSLNQSTGVISGTPSVTGTSNFTVQVQDNASKTATKGLSITINAASGGMGLLQSKAVEGSAVSSVSAAFPTANTAGNMIVAFVRMSTATQTLTVTDTAGNTYTKAVSQAQTSDGHQTYIFYAKNIAGVANTVKASFSSTNNHPWLAIYEYSGLNSTAPLDKIASAQGSGTTPACGPTAATAVANELVFGGLGLPNNLTGTVTAGSGYTLQLQDTNTSRAANETAIVSSTGAQTASFTVSLVANWTCVLATFKP